tara:strand:+ start:577 stop:3048 length:2472 start_codon:yes stop_codon:yes gene_type:complete
MKRSVQIYVEGVKLDLFDDEQIQVNSSVQNIQDISKVYSDFSQSFTVPATKTNNKVFHHWYNSDVYEYNDVIFNVNTRKSAQLDINLTPFRTGKIQLEKANLKDGKPESYTLTFYGDITTLKDAFADDKLVDLDLSSLDHTYTGTEVYNRIIDDTTDYDVRYPLISSDRLWNYGGSPSSEDITTTGGKIAYTELFPAIKVSKIFDAIAAKYSLTFNSAFFSDERFKKLFMWCKNQKTNNFITQPVKLDLNSGGSTAPLVNTDYFDYTNDTLTLQWDGTNNLNGTLMQTTWHTVYPLRQIVEVREKITVGILITSVTASWYLDIYLNGNLMTTIEGNPVPTQFQGLHAVTTFYNQFPTNQQKVFHFEMRATEATTFTGYVNYKQVIKYENTLTGAPGTQELWRQTTGTTQTLTGVNNIVNYLPDMKIADFFSGMLKMFNLTCYGTAADTYQIETLENWYNAGTLYDITKYTDIESIDITRLPLYKKIAFKYQESNSFLNKQFAGTNMREYGNLENIYNDYDGGEFNIELPFENLMGQQFTTATNFPTNVQVAFALDENFNSYIPKPCLFYMYDKKTPTSVIKFNDGTSTLNISAYMPFGQDLQINSIDDYSLNWGNEISTLLLTNVPNGLFASYYFNYLFNLYTTQNKLYSLKVVLPITILTKLQLNDRFVIRDKRFIINELKTNLTSGECQLTLIQDFRPVNPTTIIDAGGGANCVQVPVNLLSGAVSATIATTTAGVTITPSTVTSSQSIEVCVPANSTTTTFLVSEENDSTLPPLLREFVVTEELEQIMTEESAPSDILLTITHTYPDGSVNDTSVIISQP